MLKACSYSDEIVKSFETFQPFVFPLCGVGLGNTCVVICESEEVPLCSKANWRNRAYKVSVDKLIGPLCSLLWGLIVVFYGFCPLAAVTDAFVIVVFDVVTFEVFFQC